MNDSLNYDATKKLFDNRSDKKDYENTEPKVKFTRTSGQVGVKTKQVKESKLKDLSKKAAAIVVSIVIGGVGIVYAADGLVHPENYSTTYDKYKGKATPQQVWDRTPDNFKEIKDNIVGRGR